MVGPPEAQPDYEQQSRHRYIRFILATNVCHRGAELFLFYRLRVMKEESSEVAKFLGFLPMLDWRNLSCCVCHTLIRPTFQSRQAVSISWSSTSSDWQRSTWRTPLSSSSAVQSELNRLHILQDAEQFHWSRITQERDEKVTGCVD